MSVMTVFAKGDENAMNYTIEGAGTGSQGTYLVKVTCISKKKNISDAQLRRAAVHGVLFRGFSSKEHRQHHKPLAGSAANEAKHVDFYKEFFGEGGSAVNYANTIAGSREVKKVDKEYHISAIVQVDKEQLLKYLQEVGTVRGLNSAF